MLCCHTRWDVISFSLPQCMSFVVLFAQLWVSKYIPPRRLRPHLNPIVVTTLGITAPPSRLPPQYLHEQKNATNPVDEKQVLVCVDCKITHTVTVDTSN